MSLFSLIHIVSSSASADDGFEGFTSETTIVTSKKKLSTPQKRYFKTTLKRNSVLRGRRCNRTQQPITSTSITSQYKRDRYPCIRRFRDAMEASCCPIDTLAAPASTQPQSGSKDSRASAGPLALIPYLIATHAPAARLQRLSSPHCKITPTSKSISLQT